MAFARGKFGIEYNPVRRGGDPSGLLPVALGLAFLVALVSLVFTIIARVRSSADDRAAAEEAARVEETRAEPSRKTPPPAAARPAPPPAPLAPAEAARRPPRVRNLLMRLAAAEKARDTAMAASTIEQLRALPGNPAADLDDALARRLGVLNMRRLLSSGPSPWTTTAVVKRGDNASRIAREHGSTLASLVKFNGGSVDRLRVGQELKVLNHPRFSLAVHRVTRTADLSLNGKFFKRYYLTAPVRGKIGAYETPERLRRLWAEHGISLKAADRAELEMLLPAGTPVFVAEF